VFEKLKESVLDHPFRTLFFALGTLLTSRMLLPAGTPERLTIAVAAPIVVAVALYAVRERRLVLRIGGAVGAVIVLVQWITPFAPDLIPEAMHGSLMLAFWATLALTTLFHILDRTAVDSEVLFASIVLYIYIALVWADAYFLLAYFDPAAFEFSAALAAGIGDPIDTTAAGLTRQDFYYFSVTTLTTLGYGDITPTTPLAEFTASIQAMAGQLYLVVIVAYLVGMRTASTWDRQRRRMDPPSPSA